MPRAALLLAALVAALVLLAACARTQTPGVATVEAPGGPQVVTMQADSYSFTPNLVEVAAGRPVLVRVTNVSEDVHNITVLNLQGQKLASQDLPAGATRSVTFTPAGPGRYEFYCDKFGHATLGMKGEFVAVAEAEEGEPQAGEAMTR